MPKKKHLPIPFFSKPNQGIRRINEKYFEIGLSLEEQATDQKAQDHVLQLEEEIKSLSHAKEQLAHLKAFRDYLSGHCMKTGKRITIIACSGHWKKKECSFQECEIRNKWESLFF